MALYDIPRLEIPTELVSRAPMAWPMARPVADGPWRPRAGAGLQLPSPRQARPFTIDRNPETPGGFMGGPIHLGFYALGRGQASNSAGTQFMIAWRASVSVVMRCVVVLSHSIFEFAACAFCKRALPFTGYFANVASNRFPLIHEKRATKLSGVLIGPTG